MCARNLQIETLFMTMSHVVYDDCLKILSTRFYDIVKQALFVLLPEKFVVYEFNFNFWLRFIHFLMNKSIASR